MLCLLVSDIIGIRVCKDLELILNHFSSIILRFYGTIMIYRVDNITLLLELSIFSNVNSFI